MKIFIIIISSIFWISLFGFTIFKIENKEVSRATYSYPNKQEAKTFWKESQEPSASIYSSKEEKKKNTHIVTNQRNILLDFLPHICIVLLFILSSIWFLIKDNDFLLFLFFSFVALFIFSDFALLAFDDFYFSFYFSLFYLSVLLLRLSFRFKGKEFYIRWLVPEIAIVTILSFIGYVEKSPNTFDTLVLTGIAFVLLISFFNIVVILYDIFRYKTPFQLTLKKLSLALSIILISYFPFIIFYFDLFKIYENMNYFLYLAFFLFPFMFIYGTYRYSFIKGQFFYTSSLTNFYLVGGFLILYNIFRKVMLYTNVDLYIKNDFLFNILFLILFLSIANLLKHKIAKIIDYWSFGRNSKLTKTLEELVNIIASNISLKATIKSLVKRIQEVLEVSSIILLVPGDKFPKYGLKQVNVIKVPYNSEIWEYFSKQKEITITSYLTYGTGSRGDVFEFLNKLNIQLAYPMLGVDGGKNISAVFLVGNKKNHKSFTLGEIRFIKECTRLADLLLHNYSLLLSEVEKKRLIKDLNTIQIFEKTINPTSVSKIKNVDLSFLSVPAVGISGDYMDYILLDNNKLMIFLGDVSGHGIGSGYLVSAIKSLTRDQVYNGVDIIRIFKNINTFLLERYSGSEFLTLIGGIYDTRTGIFEFVNAGHLAPLLWKENNEIENYSANHRVLGVLPTTFGMSSIQLESRDKLVLYSDGITETFGPADEIYGERRFKRFLQSHKYTAIKDIPQLLEADLANFRKGNEMTDDLSFVCLLRK